jgi:hypothetical protein
MIRSDQARRLEKEAPRLGRELLQEERGRDHRRIDDALTWHRGLRG